MCVVYSICWPFSESFCKNNLVCICYEVVGLATKKQPTVTEMSKLVAEVNFLRRSLDVGKSSVFAFITRLSHIRSFAFCSRRLQTSENVAVASEFCIISF